MKKDKNEEKEEYLLTKKSDQDIENLVNDKNSENIDVDYTADDDILQTFVIEYGNPDANKNANNIKNDVNNSINNQKNENNNISKNNFNNGNSDNNNCNANNHNTVNGNNNDNNNSNSSNDNTVINKDNIHNSNNNNVNNIILFEERIEFLNYFTVDGLKKELKKYNLSTTGLKHELIERLRVYYVGARSSIFSRN